MSNLQAAAQRKYKGKYAGPDKYKGVIPKHLQSKYKGKYFGRESNKGGNPTKIEKMGTVLRAQPIGKSRPVNTETSARFKTQPVGDFKNIANKTKSVVSKRLKTPEERATGQAQFADLRKAIADKAATRTTQVIP